MTSEPKPAAERILILAPVGRDAALAAETLGQAGLLAVACADIPQLREKLAEGVGALLLTEEALAGAVDLLKETLSAQPSWSDLPLILLVGNRHRRFDYTKFTRHLEGNITLLQRPVSAASLITVSQTALRARRRQYKIRELLVQLHNQNERLALEIAEREQAQGELQELADTLEQRVANRTVELAATNRSLQKEINQRRDIQRKLGIERALLRTLIDAAPAYIFIKDLAGRYILVNNQMVQLFGAVHEANLIGKTDFDLFPQSAAIRYYIEDQIVNHSNDPLPTREEQITDADGNRLWVSYTKVPLHDEQGRQSSLLGVAWNITPRKQMEQRLQASEMRFRKIFEQGPLGMGIVDQEFRFVQANDSLCQMLGYSEAELKGRSPFEFTHPTDESKDRELAKQVYDGFIPDYQIEKRFITKSGETIWTTLTATVIRTNEDEQAFGLGMLEDITEQKRIEQERMTLLAETSRQRDQLRSLSTRLTEVQERERQRLVRELHDQVGQTLTALNFNLGFVRSQIPDDLPAAAVIQPRLTQAIDLVGQATDRIRNVMAELRPPLLDESGLLDALEWYANRFENWSNLAVFVNADPVSPRLEAATENALFRITQEALNNVIKHAEAGQVTISLQSDGQTVRLSITDDGVGFDQTDHPNGTNQHGWGIRTMAERAEMVNGKCRVESWPGRGTRVVVEVPHVSRPEIAPQSLEA